MCVSYQILLSHLKQEGSEDDVHGYSVSRVNIPGSRRDKTAMVINRRK